MLKRYASFAFALLLGMNFSSAKSIDFLVPMTPKKSKIVNISLLTLDTGDVQAPIITCMNGISVNIMPTGVITLWNTDFAISAKDNETPVNQIKFGIRKAGTGTGFPVDSMGNPITNITFDCEALGVQTVETWAIDLQGNADYCTTTVQVLDNNMNCSNNGLDGRLCFREYCSGLGISEVVLRIYSDTLLSNPPVMFYQTGSDNACFDVPNFDLIDSTFIMALAKDDNPANGVTAYDILLISKHIRGIQPFTEPWQWVAADANQDYMVDAQDSLELIHLILGINQYLPNEASWRFVRSDYVFPSPNPLSQPLPETIRVGELVDSAQVLFLGIKIGDLTIDCQPQTPVKTPANSPNFYAAVNPNPTTKGAMLSVYVEHPATARLQIRDISGKLTFDSVIQLPAGKQSLEIPEIALPVSGMYFYNLQIEGNMVSGKIIRI